MVPPLWEYGEKVPCFYSTRGPTGSLLVNIESSTCANLSGESSYPVSLFLSLTTTSLISPLAARTISCNLSQCFQVREYPGSVARSTRGTIQTALPVATTTTARSSGEHRSRHRAGRQHTEAPPAGLHGLLDGEIAAQRHDDNVSIPEFCELN